MEKLRISCPCLFGLESVLSGEMKRMGAENITAEDGRVTFEGTFADAARANLCLRTAERVQIIVAEFEARSYEELFQGTLAAPWEEFIGRKDAFPVKGRTVKSQLYSMSDCQSIIKKAVAKRLESVYHQSWFDETGSVIQIQFTLLKDRVMLMLDTSGTGLHKRGYRRNSVDAPIKETIAAGIADLAHIYPDSVVCDPMCGSGTLLIESALKALNIAPGINRHFAAEQWSCWPAETWQQERSRCLDEIRRDATFEAYGSDIDPEAVRLTIENANNAGVGGRIHVEQRDMRKFEFPEAERKLIVLCNPPYGERLLDIKEAEALYRDLGRVLQPGEGRSFNIISPHDEFESLFGRKADRRRKLYNGMIKCQLYMYFK
ncbi:MAG: class I SAM-dependent RNA methyltransferase [Oscillospiraceae bacterium]